MHIYDQLPKHDPAFDKIARYVERTFPSPEMVEHLTPRLDYAALDKLAPCLDPATIAAFNSLIDRNNHFVHNALIDSESARLLSRAAADGDAIHRLTT